MMSNSACLNGGRHLVLDDLDPGPVADHLGAVLERLDPADVQPDRRVELQRLAAGGGLGRAEHHADLLAQLVDEDRRGLGLAEGAGDLAQRLGHQPGLQADVAVAHLALDLGLGHQRGDRVDDDDVDGAGADQHVRDLQRLLAGVRLGDEQGVGVHAELLRVVRVQRVLGVDERRDAARLLRVGHGVQRHGGLAASSPGRRSRRSGRAGRPPMPSATSRAIEPVGITSTGTRASSPSRMTVPLPNCRSIWASAASSAFSLSLARSGLTTCRLVP